MAIEEYSGPLSSEVLAGRAWIWFIMLVVGIVAVRPYASNFWQKLVDKLDEANAKSEGEEEPG